jgi:putative NADH-flavin reductase
MESKYKIAVIGGTGKSGQFLVIHLLKLGIPIKMLIRNPENFQLKSPLIEIIRGDARDPRAVYSLIEGCNAVISTLGQPKNEPPIFSDATRNVISAMDFFRIRRYIITTGINVDTPQDKKTGYTEAATEWMKDNYPKTTADKQTEWDLLVASALDWTLVRLPYIELTDKKSEVKINLEDCPGEKISATSLAEFLADQLNDTTYFKQSPFISNGIS